MDWEVNPSGLRALLVRLGFEYPNLPPLYVTENGGAYNGDTVDEDGHVHDPDRTAYIVQHIQAVADAVADGADVRGYFLWSFLDNFEWAWGFHKRFGIVHVDYASQVRTVKDSGLAYSSLIRGAGTSTRPPD
jgi:beta-glucosidase